MKEDLLVQISIMFYEENLTQTEIAKKLKISRPTVAARLQEAKDKGIVKITIRHEQKSYISLQNRLMKNFNIKNVLISSSKNLTNKQIKYQIGSLCASFISSQLPSIRSLGIGWGTTVHKFVQAVDYQEVKDISIVSLIGGAGNSEVEFHSNHLAFVLAEKYRCKVDYFYAPAIADTLEMKDNFKESQVIKDAIRKGKNVNLAVLGVGNPLESSTYSKLGYINEEEAREIKEKGAVGDIGANFYNIDGEEVITSFSSRMVGLSLDDISKIKEIAIVASGKEKAISILGLLNKGLIDHLIIDSDLAEILDTWPLNKIHD